MGKIILFAILVFTSCQAENEKSCDLFEPVIVEAGEVQKQSCCNGEITETGFALESGEPTYSHNTMNCGNCGVFCHNGCICNFNNSQVDCECTGAN